MRKLIVIFMLFTAGWVKAQQLSQYSQYMMNHFLLNPAAVSSKKCLEVKGGYRTQWVGFSGAPINQFVSICTFLKTKKAFRKGRHAVGGYIEADDTPPLFKQALYLSYSYHIPIGRELWAGMGLHAGIMQYGLDVKGVYTVQQDNAISSQTALLYPDLNPGLWVYSNDLYAGLSIKNAAGNKLTKVHGFENRLTRHVNLTAGYRFRTYSKKFSFIPSTNIRLTHFAPPGVDVNLLVDYMNRLAIGVSYRTTDAVIAMVRIGVGKVITIGYSFDYTTSKIRVSSSNSHEIIVGLKLCKGKPEREEKYECPAYQ